MMKRSIGREYVLEKLASNYLSRIEKLGGLVGTVSSNELIDYDSIIFYTFITNILEK